MKVETCGIQGLLEITPDVHKDSRGYFYEVFQLSRYQEAGLCDIWNFTADGKVDQRYGIVDFIQDNESYSQKGTLRGLHWQAAPCMQAKLVRVISGKVWDVAVDLRRNSPTFGKWHGVELDGENKKQFFIPTGFAHGFVALEDSVFSYKCTNVYNKASERGLRWNDPDIGIEWPDVGVAHIISDKDMVHPFLSQIKPDVDL